MRARAAQGELALRLGAEERPPPRLLACPCGGKRKVVALVRDPEEIRSTLDRLGLPCAPLKSAKARPLAQRIAFQRHSDFDGLDPPPPD